MKLLKRLYKLITKFLPEYAIIPFLACWIVNSLLYEILLVIPRINEPHYLYTGFDELIPFYSVFVFLYFGSFPIWFAIYAWVARKSRDTFFRLILSDFICRFICFIIYILYPVTIDRPEYVVDNFSTFLVDLLFKIDQPANLFPSIHCLVSWLCFISVRRLKNIKLFSKGIVLVIALLIFMSTFSLKQHYILDCVSAVVLGELVFAGLRFGNLVSRFEAFSDRLTCHVWRNFDEVRKEDNV